MPTVLHLYECKRCKRDEHDCRANGCSFSPCPMEYVGDKLYGIPLETMLCPRPTWMQE